MADTALRLEAEGGVLLAVPAVHYRAIFAEHVNLACASETGRPAAVAVELGPALLAEVVAWLKELIFASARRDQRMFLPCMLGLLRANRHLHPKYRSAALELQRMTGRRLHEIPPDVLRKNLGYASQSLLCLSPTDSIIEAIRCGMELGVPVYGVDLEDFGHIERAPTMIQDPLDAQQDLTGYVRRNERLAESCRDPDIDLNRERAMAARLKGLLRQHGTVLFTGGLAHWVSIQRLLADETLRPADVPAAAGGGAARRVLVHPVLATHQMDLFPDITALYQDHRRPVPRRKENRDSVDFGALFGDQLRTTYGRFFSDLEKQEQAERKIEDYGNLAAFERYLVNVALMSQRLVPDLNTVLEAAEAMMSKRFCEAIANTFMEYEPGWAKPQDWPDLPIVGLAPLTDTEQAFLSVEDKVTLLIPGQRSDGAEGQSPHSRSEPFYLARAPDPTRRRTHVRNPWVWPETNDLTGEGGGSGSSSTRVWPPCDNLLFATAFQAGEMVHHQTQHRVVDPFEGSLYDGIDIKATIRSAIKGEDRIYVRHPALSSQTASVADARAEPTVLILASQVPGDAAQWHNNVISEECAQFVRDPSRYRSFTQKMGTVFVPGISYDEEKPVPESLRAHVQSVYDLRGIVVFGNPCLDAHQEAHYLEATDYARCPVFQGGGVPGLVRMYADRHHLNIDVANWPSALALFGLPYARRRIVVIAPDFFSFGPVVMAEARSRGIHLHILPLSYFPAERIQEVKRRLMVVPLDRNGTQYSSELALALNQGPNTHLDLLPKEFRDQTKIPIA